MKEGKPSKTVFKLDMTKAHDRVSWFCMMKVLIKMGFNEFVVDLNWKFLANIWLLLI